MYTGKTRFLTNNGASFHSYDFQQCVDRYQGNYKIKSFSCLGSIPLHGLCPTDLPREPARYRSLSAGQPKEQALSHGLSLYGLSQHSGSCQPKSAIGGSMPIFAHTLITQGPVKLYAQRSDFGMELEAIRFMPWTPPPSILCLSHVSRGPIPSRHKGADQTPYACWIYVETFPTLIIHISDGKLHEVKTPGRSCRMEAGSHSTSSIEAIWTLHVCTKSHRAAAFFITRAKSQSQVSGASIPIRSTKATGLQCDQINQCSHGFYASTRIIPDKLRRVKYYDAETDKTPGFPNQQFYSACHDHCRTVS